MSKDILDIFNFDSICRFLGLTRSAIRRNSESHKKEKEILRHHGENALSDLKKLRSKKK